MTRRNNFDTIHKFGSKEAFKKAERAIRAYVSDTHPDNGWNEATKENAIQIYNFDTAAGSLGAGLNVLLMHVQYQTAEGTYAPTEAERKLHEWAAEKIGSPEAPANVNPRLVQQVIDAYNENANYGNVPTALFKLDSNYWMGVVSDKLCDLDETCDPETGEIRSDCSPIQCADAATWSTYHRLIISMEPYSCQDDETCRIVDEEAGSGRLSAFLEGGQNHATSTSAHYYVYNRSYVVTYPVSHEVEGYTAIGFDRRDMGPVTGIDEIYFEGVMHFSGECGGRDRNCGTYSMGMTAQPATFET